MAYNTELEELIDAKTSRWQNCSKKKLFGGICWLLKGNMCFGIWKDFLIVRMDKEQGEASLKKANVRPFDITGKPMSGWVMVGEKEWKKAATLAQWMKIGKKYALSLPEKKAKAKKKKTLREYNLKT